MTQFARHFGPGLAARKGRKPVLKAGEIGGRLVAQDIGAGGKELSEFDGDGPKIDEGGGQPFPRPAACPAPAEEPRHLQDRRRQPRALDQLGEGRQRPVARQGAGHDQEPGDVARPAEQHRQIRQAEWSAAMPPERFR